jgi:hypothetical protein
MCPAGTFGNTTGLTTALCSGPCAEGFQCLAGSVSATPGVCATYISCAALGATCGSVPDPCNPRTIRCGPVCFLPSLVSWSAINTLPGTATTSLLWTFVFNQSVTVAVNQSVAMVLGTPIRFRMSNFTTTIVDSSTLGCSVTTKVVQVNVSLSQATVDIPVWSNVYTCPGSSSGFSYLPITILNTTSFSLVVPAALVSYGIATVALVNSVICSVTVMPQFCMAASGAFPFNFVGMFSFVIV